MGGSSRTTASVSRQATREKYNRMSRFYDFLEARNERKCIEAGLGMLGVREGERVLEVGFGTGNALLTLAEASGERGRVFGVDLSDGMLAVARGKLERRGVAGAADLVVGDAAELPFEDSSVDAVFMSFVLELFSPEDIPVVLGECGRVLRTGGRLAVVCLSDRGRPRAMRTAYVWVHERFPRIVDCRPIGAGKYIEEAGMGVVEDQPMSIWSMPVDVLLATKR